MAENRCYVCGGKLEPDGHRCTRCGTVQIGTMTATQVRTVPVSTRSETPVLDMPAENHDAVSRGADRAPVSERGLGVGGGTGESFSRASGGRSEFPSRTLGAGPNAQVQGMSSPEVAFNPRDTLDAAGASLREETEALLARVDAKADLAFAGKAWTVGSIFQNAAADERAALLDFINGQWGPK